MNLAEISFIIILAILGAFYLMFIRPARQEQRKLEDTIRDLHVGDEVITMAGFYATVKGIETPEEGPILLTLDLGNGLEVRAVTSAISKRVSSAVEVDETSPAEADEVSPAEADEVSSTEVDEVEAKGA